MWRKYVLRRTRLNCIFTGRDRESAFYVKWKIGIKAGLQGSIKYVHSTMQHSDGLKKRDVTGSHGRKWWKIH